MDTADHIEPAATSAPPEPNHHALLNAVMVKLDCKNDAALARALKLGAPVISKIRHYRRPVDPGLILRIYDKASMSIEDIRAHLATPVQ